MTIEGVEELCKDQIQKYKSCLSETNCGIRPIVDQGKKTLLPTLKQILEQPNFKATYVPGELKVMGETYNPFNYNLDKMRSTIRRNVYGSLFQH